MPKGQQRSNREQKKPKQSKLKAAAVRRNAPALGATAKESTMTRIN